jgi:hypothetical protein
MAQAPRAPFLVRILTLLAIPLVPFLSRVNAKRTKGRLSLFASVMVKVFNSKAWPKLGGFSIGPPSGDAKVLDKIGLGPVPLGTPVHDEDWPDRKGAELWVPVFCREHIPVWDGTGPEATWEPGEDKHQFLMDRLRKIWPEQKVSWEEVSCTSDAALTHLVFHSLGQHLVELVPEGEGDARYAVMLDSLSRYSVRPGLAPYGADVYFDADLAPVRITRLGEDIFPSDGARWEYAKFCFRATLLSAVTVVDHLCHLHLVQANCTMTAVRETLSPSHPVRVLYKPFIYRTAAINFMASVLLTSIDGLAYRALALDEFGFKRIFYDALQTIRHETLGERFARTGVAQDERLRQEMPMLEDALGFEAIVSAYVGDYLDLYYADDRAIAEDEELAAFAENLNLNLPKHDLGPVTTKAELNRIVTHHIVLCTAYHSHVGRVSDFLDNPEFCSGTWVEGEASPRPQGAMMIAILMSATSFALPKLLDDWTGVLKDDAAKSRARKFIAEAEAYGREIDRRNATRPFPYVDFDPRDMNSSVSI